MFYIVYVLAANFPRAALFPETDSHSNTPLILSVRGTVVAL